MSAKQQSVTICCLLMATLLLSACGSGELFSPTITPILTSTPTRTPTPTSTNTSTPTETPMPTHDPRILNSENQHLYLYIGQEKTWHSANNYCLSLGGYLVEIDSVSENDFVYNLSGGGTWLGASDESKEGTWVWSSGQPFDFKYWEKGEPSNCCPPQNCGGTSCTPEHYLTFTGHDKTWNDVPSGNDVPSETTSFSGTITFVCEWEPASP